MPSQTPNNLTEIAELLEAHAEALTKAQKEMPHLDLLEDESIMVLRHASRMDLGGHQGILTASWPKMRNLGVKAKELVIEAQCGRFRIYLPIGKDRLYIGLPTVGYASLSCFSNHEILQTSFENLTTCEVGASTKWGSKRMAKAYLTNASLGHPFDLSYEKKIRYKL